MPAEDLLALGVTGPLLRATGHPWDLRKAAPYSGYENFDFNVPVGTVGDNYDRFRVRVEEMLESLKIIEQALDGLPEGPYITTNRKVALPPRHELATSMEALIHHFKLVTEGFRVPPARRTWRSSRPGGELGRYVLADGLQACARAHARPELREPAGAAGDGAWPPARGLHRGVAMLDLILEDGPASIDPGGLRESPLPPGWDEAVDLEAPPATIPDPADVEVPDALRSEIERLMALYPDRHSATLPALGAAQRVHGWCSPEAMLQVAAVMQVTPAYSVERGHHVLRHAAHRAAGQPLRVRLHERGLPRAQREEGL